MSKLRRMRTIALLTLAVLAARGAEAQSPSATSQSGGAATTAFIGGRVLDGSGRVIDNATVVITGDRITAVGGSSTAVPAGATRVDARGKTLLPGLINAHGHVGNTVGLSADKQNGYSRENLTRQLRTYAQYGVTTVFSLGDDVEGSFALRDAPAVDRARLFVAGPVITGTTADEARAMVATVAAMKPDVIKIRVDDNLGASRKMPEPAWRAVIEEAHARKLPVAVHVYWLADAKATVDAGADMIAHSVRDTAVDDPFIAAMKARDICYSPTLTREISTFIYDSAPPWVDDPFFTRGVGPDIPAQLKDPKRHEQVRNSPGWKAGQQYKAGLEVARRNLKTLVDKGVRIAFGTDTGPPARFQGFFEHLELEMMVDAGLTPMQAIVSATGDAARCHRRAGQFGTLAPGAAADLLVLGANPLDNIRNTRSIEQVWIGGRKVF